VSDAIKSKNIFYYQIRRVAKFATRGMSSFRGPQPQQTKKSSTQTRPSHVDDKKEGQQMMQSSHQSVTQPSAKQSTGAVKDMPISNSSEFDSLWYPYVKEELSMKNFLTMIVNLNGSLTRNHQSLVIVTETTFKEEWSFGDLYGVLRYIYIDIDICIYVIYMIRDDTSFTLKMTRGINV
jgi:hypothetical protein